MPLLVAVGAEDAASDLGPAGAHEAAEAQDLAATKVERDVLEHPCDAQAADREDGLARLWSRSSDRARR